MEQKISMMDTLTIRTATPFKNLFPIRENLLDEIAADMKANGYDFAHPIIIWAGHKVTVVDGHTRLAAALKIGLTKVPITLKEFESEEEALQYAIKSQSHRRNLTDAELLACISELDKRKRVGRPEKTPSREGISGESAENTAKLLNISRAKVERLRTVKDHGSDKTKAAVASGKMTINKAYNETMKQRRAKEHSVREVKPEDVKKERLKAIEESIVKMVAARIEREIQEYPEIRYSEQERQELIEGCLSAITAALENLPRETTENETC